jgi:hypothetical protein
MCIYISIYIKKKFPLVVPTLVNTMLYLNYYKIHILNQHTNLSFILEWQRHFQIVGHKNYNLGVNEDFVMFLTSKLMTCFIDGFTSKMKSQSIVYLLIRSAYIYIYRLDSRPWRWSALNTGFVDKQPSRMQGQSSLSSQEVQAIIFGRV